VSMTFRTFDVVGSRLGRAHAASLADKLKAFRFTGLGSSEGKASGWVGPEHLLDSDFDPIKIVHGPFLGFGYRVDKRKVPADVLAAHVAIELAAWLEANGGTRVPKGVRQKTKKDVKERLLAETTPAQKATPCWWDLSEGRLYVGSSSASVADGVRELFARTFDDPERGGLRVSLRTRFPRLLADDLVSTLGVAYGQFETAAVLRELEPLALFGTKAPASQDFLGREFLTWLWFRGEGECDVDVVGADSENPQRVVNGSRAHRLALETRGEAVTVFVNDALSFVGADKADTAVSVRKGAPTARPEATAALRAGLMLRRASVTIARGGSCWTCSLDGETFDVSGLKISRPEKIHEEPGEKHLFEEGADAPEGDEPKAPAEKVEAHDAKAERLGEAADLRETIDALFATFLETRLSPVVWPEVERAMRTWVLQKGVKEAAREARELEEVSRELFAELEERNPRCAAAVAATLAKPHGVEAVAAALEVVKAQHASLEENAEAAAVAHFSKSGAATS